ncbi:MAG: adenylate/guanylate cyclase domain-containing protein [Jatrophihabitans sp.]
MAARTPPQDAAEHTDADGQGYSLLAEVIANLDQEIERVLLGGSRRLTKAAATSAADVSIEVADELWRSLGFPAVPAGAEVFTDGDVRALRIVKELVDTQVLRPDELTSVTRMMGQTMSRLADWQGRLFADRLVNAPETLPDADPVGFLARLVELLTEVQELVWRRHLAALVPRLISEVTATGDGSQARELAVGFADMTGYTSLTRRVSARTLTVILETFEAIASDLAAENGGRIVKTLGDEVLFVADSAHGAAQIALWLLERAETDERLPSLRTGLASGAVLTRLGDVYGPVVNIASRLTTLAKPGSVLIDRAMAAALQDDDQFTVRATRRASVQGYSRLHPYLLRRTP